jgi:uncharacterized oxidoreductase
LSILKQKTVNTSKNVILITGGGSGIGYETAKLFAANDNQVILAGTDAKNLQLAAASMRGAIAIPTDITNEREVYGLVQQVTEDFGQLNVLINNAGKAFAYDLLTNGNAYEYAVEEMAVNYFAPINLTQQLLPLLMAQPRSAIINITSILAISPLAVWSTYSASKAAFQSYTKILRLSLAGSNVNVIEILPPLTDTSFAKDIPGPKITPQEVAKAIFDAFHNDTPEVRVGFTETYYNLYLKSPQMAFNAMHGIK